MLSLNPGGQNESTGVATSETRKPALPASVSIALWAGVVLLLLQTCLSVYVVAVGMKPARGAWEYRVAAVSDESFDDTMSKAGAIGWEVVSARRASNGGDKFSYEMIFRRPARASQ